MNSPTLPRMISVLAALGLPLRAAEKESSPTPPNVPPPHASAAEVPQGFRAEVLMSGLIYGEALYVVDFGALVVSGGKAVPASGSGVVWRIVPDDLQDIAPRAGLSARSAR